MRDSISVVCAVNRAFAMPLGVMMRSVVMNRSRDLPITFYIFESGLESSDRNHLEAAASGAGVSVFWLDADHARLQGLPRAKSLCVYDRLLIGDKLPASLSKAIWLDADLLVLRDIGELWNAEIGGQALLAIQDMAIPYVSSPLGVKEWRVLGLRSDAAYFNSGVLVLDLKIWRREDIGRKAIEYLRSRKRSVVTYDQEALNAMLASRWGTLDPRWNLIASIAGRRFQENRHLSSDVNRRTVEDPWILHYAGDWKPWTLPRGRRSYDLYFSYLDKTPWKGWRPRSSVAGSLRALYHDHLRETLYPIEKTYTAFRLGRLPEHFHQTDPRK